MPIDDDDGDGDDDDADDEDDMTNKTFAACYRAPQAHQANTHFFYAFNSRTKTVRDCFQ